MTSRARRQRPAPRPRLEHTGTQRRTGSDCRPAWSSSHGHSMGSAAHLSHEHLCSSYLIEIWPLLYFWAIAQCGSRLNALRIGIANERTQQAICIRLLFYHYIVSGCMLPFRWYVSLCITQISIRRPYLYIGRYNNIMRSVCTSTHTHEVISAHKIITKAHAHQRNFDENRPTLQCGRENEILQFAQLICFILYSFALQKTFLLRCHLHCVSGIQFSSGSRQVRMMSSLYNTPDIYAITRHNGVLNVCVCLQRRRQATCCWSRTGLLTWRFVTPSDREMSSEFPPVSSKGIGMGCALTHHGRCPVNVYPSP